MALHASAGRHSSPSSFRRVSIAIPASVVEVYDDDARRTVLVGRIARAAAIFRVSEIIVYPDRGRGKQVGERRFISLLLEYLDTPQYLRKHLFPRRPELRYAGLLPPLRTPHHPTEGRMSRLRGGEVREGYVFRRGGRLWVDVGVERPIPLLTPPAPPRTTSRVTVRITKTGKEVVASPSSPPEGVYWGYRVLDEKRSLGRLLRRRGGYDLVVATSRKGVPVQDVWEQLRRSWVGASRILLLFGGPGEGLYEIVRREGLDLPQLVDFVVNTVPGQGVATVRTEEAVLLSLAVLHLLEMTRIGGRGEEKGDSSKGKA